MASLLKRFETNNVFRENEAWSLFRLAAIGEAIGWSLLISGILCKQYLLHGNNDPVLFAGQIHGMLFFLYALSSLGLYPSLHWSRRRACIALLASIPPYGSLLFEQWASYKRHRSALQTYSQCIRWMLLLDQLPT
jgi:integral membrane protein